jgi:hypothetical protein
MSLKLWFRTSAALALSLTLSATIAVAGDHGRGHDKHDRDDDHDRWHEKHQESHGHGHAYGHEKYRDHDRDIHDWYRAHYRHLPPGLAKRDRLPPGLERRLVVSQPLPPEIRLHAQPCPRELEVMLPPPPPNYVHAVIGGNLVLYNRVNFQVADVFHFDATF